MSLKKDKQKVLGENLNDERIKTFLHAEASGQHHPDYIALERAYRGMNEENFASFVKFFAQSGKDFNAVNAAGQTLLQVISAHRHGQGYRDILLAAGAH